MDVETAVKQLEATGANRQESRWALDSEIDYILEQARKRKVRISYPEAVQDAYDRIHAWIETDSGLSLSWDSILRIASTHRQAAVWAMCAGNKIREGRNRANAEERDEARDERIRKLAKDQHLSEGEVEIDEGAVISEGDDNGTYVQAWVWVDFSGTELDKETEEEETTG